jgi:hypothetical protein
MGREEERKREREREREGFRRGIFCSYFEKIERMSADGGHHRAKAAQQKPRSAAALKKRAEGEREREE